MGSCHAHAKEDAATRTPGPCDRVLIPVTIRNDDGVQHVVHVPNPRLPENMMLLRWAAAKATGRSAASSFLLRQERKVATHLVYVLIPLSGARST
jgi:hypothetical protein